MNTSRALVWLLAAAAVAGLASCSHRTPTQPEPEVVLSPASSGPVSDSLLQASQARWSASRIDSYWYRFRWICYCGIDYVRRVDIHVKSGVVTSVIDAETGKPLTAQEVANYRTIEGLFDFVRGAIDRPADSVNGAFDSNLGIPITMGVDYEAGLADDELGFQIESLRPSLR